jgi:hypothetical protein
MSVEETMELVLKSSNHNPYSGRLSKLANYTAAIELSDLCKHFAKKGQIEEAMNLDAAHWDEVIGRLKSQQIKI